MTIGSFSARVRQRWLGFFALGGLAIAAPVEATTAFGLTTTNSIVAFDTNAPGAPIGSSTSRDSSRASSRWHRSASGHRPDLRARVVEPALRGQPGHWRGHRGRPTLLAGPVRHAFRLRLQSRRQSVRLVSDTGQNLRLNPDDGAVVAVDTNLNPGAPHIVEVAYANNAAGTATTTLYAIDAATNQLFIQNPPNGGTLGLVGALGVDTTDLVGFDIAANDNAAYATLSIVNTSLYRIDLATGAATLIGTVGGGPYLGLTLVARSVPLIALRNGVELVRFHSATPGTVFSVTPVTGLQPGETLVGIDLRPTNGLVYGVGSTSRVYVVDPMSGGATPVGPPFSPLLAGSKFGVDVNLQEDSLRVVSDTGQTSAST